MADEQLKPCPFCGSDDIDIFEDDYDDHYIAHACKTGDISVFVKYIHVNTEGHRAKADAIKAWNTRFDASARIAALDEAAAVAETIGQVERYTDDRAFYAGMGSEPGIMQDTAAAIRALKRG